MPNGHAAMLVNVSILILDDIYICVTALRCRSKCRNHSPFMCISQLCVLIFFLKLFLVDVINVLEWHDSVEWHVPWEWRGQTWRVYPRQVTIAC